MNGAVVFRASVPGGLWLDGADACRRDFALRPVSGADEMFLLDSENAALPGERATALLDRCLVGADGVAARLSIGDREALLLQLRRMTLGDHMDCTQICPEPDCAERMEFTLSTTQLLHAPYEHSRPVHELKDVVAGHTYLAHFRAPTVDEVDRAARVARVDPERAGAELLRCCVSAVTRDSVEVGLDALPSPTLKRLDAAIAEIDPQAETELALTCPACGVAFSATFECATYFLSELAARARHLLHDVHTLASYYHWSESDILALTPGRRDRYIAKIAESLSGA